MISISSRVHTVNDTGLQQLTLITQSASCSERSTSSNMCSDGPRSKIETDLVVLHP